MGSFSSFTSGLWKALGYSLGVFLFTPLIVVAVPVTREWLTMTLWPGIAIWWPQPGLPILLLNMTYVFGCVVYQRRGEEPWALLTFSILIFVAIADALQIAGGADPTGWSWLPARVGAFLGFAGVLLVAGAVAGGGFGLLARRVERYNLVTGDWLAGDYDHAQLAAASDLDARVLGRQIALAKVRREASRPGGATPLAGAGSPVARDLAVWRGDTLARDRQAVLRAAHPECWY